MSAVYRVYLKDTPEMPSISSLTSNEVGWENAEHQKGAL